MSETEPRVSVIIPTYKRPAFLGRAIDSVLDQTYSGWDLTIVDDNGRGSDAQMETEELLAVYRADPRIGYIAHDENLGGSAARNTGIRRSKGALVAFLDDDDAWKRDKLERQIACLDRAGDDVCLVYTGSEAIEEADGTTYLETPELRGHVFSSLLAHNHVGTTSSILCRREAIVAVGSFDERLGANQDYDLYLRLAQRCAFDFVAAPLVLRHKHLEERVTKAWDVKIRSSDAIYRKHADAFAAHPRARSDYLFTHARLLVAAGARAAAARTFLRSFRADPRRVARLGYALMAALGPPAYGAVREATRPLRLWLRRTVSRARRSARRESEPIDGG